MTKVWIHGVNGRMGSELQTAFSGGMNTVVGGSDQDKPMTFGPADVDLIVDFSSPEGNAELQRHLESHKGMSVLIGTTGLKLQQLATWKKLGAFHRILVAPNTSLGVMAMSQAARLIRRLLPAFDVELVETHHRLKIDQPSGTALFLAESVAHADQSRPLEIICDRTQKREPKQLGVHAVRGGTVFGEHQLMFLGESEEVHLTHRAQNRQLFARGALALAKWLTKQPPGYYRLEDVDLTMIR